ncbi:MAG TPA: hypothetical protein PK037_06175 [Saprospiraceae bacterium]|nr:hypothetical protein [Saprospiraceae bacterium]
MKILNVHERTLPVAVDKVLPLFHSLSSDKDLFWPVENWPRMRFKQGLKLGSIGGHGPIKYEVIEYDALGLISFRFLKPEGFRGSHTFKITAVDGSHTKLHHEIKMDASSLDYLYWSFVIRWLHDALMEDAFDKATNYLTNTNKHTPWNWWVKILRWLLTSKKMSKKVPSPH